MVAKRAAEHEDLEGLKRSKAGMTPEQNELLLKISEDQSITRVAVQQLAEAQQRRDEDQKEVLKRLTALEEEMAMTINANERLAQLEADVQAVIRATSSKTDELNSWQVKATAEFEALHEKMRAVLTSMQEADILFQGKVQSADQRFDAFNGMYEGACKAMQNTVASLGQELQGSQQHISEQGCMLQRMAARISALEDGNKGSAGVASDPWMQPGRDPWTRGTAGSPQCGTGPINAPSGNVGGFTQPNSAPPSAHPPEMPTGPGIQNPYVPYSTVTGQYGRKRLCEEKGRMASIELCTSMDRFSEFSEHLRLVAGELHPLLDTWLHELDRLPIEPTEVELNQWFGHCRGDAEIMGRDIWDVMAIKLGGNPKKVVLHSMRQGGTVLVKASRAWWRILRDSHGRVSDRKLKLTGVVHNPPVAPSWSEFAACFRKWEDQVSDYESIVGTRMDPALKTQAILLIAPPNLREQARSQAGLEDNYTAIRDYLLSQTGRRVADTTTHGTGPAPMDIGALEQEDPHEQGPESEYTEGEWNAFLFGKAGRKGKQGRGGKPTTGKGWPGAANPGKAGNPSQPAAVPASPVTCWTCKGTGHRSPECANNKRDQKLQRVDECRESCHETSEESTGAHGVHTPGAGAQEPAVDSTPCQDKMLYTLTENEQSLATDWNARVAEADGTMGLMVESKNDGRPDTDVTTTDPAINALTMAEPGPGEEVLRSVIDSGAARSVCPVKHGEQFGLTSTPQSRAGSGFRTATNKRVSNLGSRKVVGVNHDNQQVGMNYAVANVTAALDSVSQICDTAAGVWFGPTGGYILEKNGKKVPFHRDGDTYVREVRVPKAPFPRPRISA